MPRSTAWIAMDLSGRAGAADPAVDDADGLEELRMDAARAVAIMAFGDRTGPYGDSLFEHSERVASRLEGTEAKTVAWLHDVVEDTDVTLDEIGAAFDAKTTVAVDALTRRKDETYFSYVERAGSDALAREVKIADIEDHLERGGIPGSLVNRYTKALLLLQSTGPRNDRADIEADPSEGMEP